MRTIERAARVAAIGIRAAVGVSPLPQDLHQPVVLYLLVSGCNLPGSIVAAVAGCTKQNVSKHLRRVEDLREQARFDAALTGLETQLFGDPTWMS